MRSPGFSRFSLVLHHVKRPGSNKGIGSDVFSDYLPGANIGPALNHNAGVDDTPGANVAILFDDDLPTLESALRPLALLHIWMGRRTENSDIGSDPRVGANLDAAVIDKEAAM